MRNTILAAVLALASAPALANGWWLSGVAVAGSEASVSSGTATFAVNNGSAEAGTTTGAVNFSGASVDVDHGGFWDWDGASVDTTAYSIGGTSGLSYGIQSGDAFGITGGSAYQGGYGDAWGVAFEF